MSDPNKYRNYNSNIEAPKLKCREIRVTDIISPEFDDVEERVTLLEDDMNTAQADVISIQGRLTTAEGEIDSAQADITALQTKTQNITAVPQTTTLDGNLIIPSPGSIYVANTPYDDTSTQKLRAHQSGASGYLDFSGDGKLHFRYGTSSVTDKFVVDGVNNNCTNVGPYYGTAFVTNYSTVPSQVSQQIGYTTRTFYSTTTDTIVDRTVYSKTSPAFTITAGIWLVNVEVVFTSTGLYTGQVYECAVGLCRAITTPVEFEYVQNGVHYSGYNFAGGNVSAYTSFKAGCLTARHTQIYVQSTGSQAVGFQFMAALTNTVQIIGPRTFMEFTRIG